MNESGADVIGSRMDEGRTETGNYLSVDVLYAGFQGVAIGLAAYFMAGGVLGDSDGPIIRKDAISRREGLFGRPGGGSE